MKKLYVASKYENKLMVSSWIGSLERAGYNITFDWTIGDELEDMKKDGHAGLIAARELYAVISADILVVIVPAEGGRGMWVEMGCALGLGKNVILVPERFSRVGHTTLKFSDDFIARKLVEVSEMCIFNELCHVASSYQDVLRLIELM